MTKIGKIVFLGTPDFAVPSLKALIDNGYDVAAVITQPDKPKGRGHKMLPPPTKVFAEQNGIPVYQFSRISREGVDTLKELAPDLMITAAFGQILSREVLSIPKLGCINVHGSLLPKYRGAAPIQWAIINGEKKTGITTMYTVYELDAGDMLLKEEIDIPHDITGGELFDKLSYVGADCLIKTLKALENDTLERIPQSEDEATYYPMFERNFGNIDFSSACEQIHNFVRALVPAPCAYFKIGNDKYKVFKVSPANLNSDAPEGTVVAADIKNGLCVKAGDGVISIDELQKPGGKRMTAKDFLRGNSIEVGTLL